MTDALNSVLNYGKSLLASSTPETNDKATPEKSTSENDGDVATKPEGEEEKAKEDHGTEPVTDPQAGGLLYSGASSLWEVGKSAVDYASPPLSYAYNQAAAGMQCASDYLEVKAPTLHSGLSFTGGLVSTGAGYLGQGVALATKGVIYAAPVVINGAWSAGEATYNAGVAAANYVYENAPTATSTAIDGAYYAGKVTYDTVANVANYVGDKFPITRSAVNGIWCAGETVFNAGATAGTFVGSCFSSAYKYMSGTPTPEVTGQNSEAKEDGILKVPEEKELEKSQEAKTSEGGTVPGNNSPSGTGNVGTGVAMASAIPSASSVIGSATSLVSSAWGSVSNWMSGK